MLYQVCHWQCTRIQIYFPPTECFTYHYETRDRCPFIFLKFDRLRLSWHPVLTTWHIVSRPSPVYLARYISIQCCLLLLLHSLPNFTISNSLCDIVSHIPIMPHGLLKWIQRVPQIPYRFLTVHWYGTRFHDPLLSFRPTTRNQNIFSEYQHWLHDGQTCIYRRLHPSSCLALSDFLIPKISPSTVPSFVSATSCYFQLLKIYASNNTRPSHI